MVPISARGAWLCHRAGRIDWRSASWVGAASVVAAVLGARAAIGLPNDVLKVALGAFLLAAGVRLLIPAAKDGRGSPQRPAGYTLRALAGGALVGFIAVPLGTRLQQKLPAQALHWLFAGLFVGLGARIILVNLTDLLRR